MPPTKKIIARLKRQYHAYLKLEKGFSPNTVAAYERDVDKWLAYAKGERIDPLSPDLEQLQHFTALLADVGIHPSSRKRILCGMHSFFRFLCLDGTIEQDPMELFDFPAVPQHLPEVLSVAEVDRLEQTIDLTHPLGHRNRAIIEVLFSCGLRVSELCALRMSDLFLEERFLRVNGKGSKQRLVPLSDKAVKELRLWFTDRCHINIRKGEEDFVFVGLKGSRISRIAVFTFIKELVSMAGIEKNVSPHTFRHSFATSLLEGGASLRAIQAMLGHESIGTTEIYLHTDVRQLREEILHHHPREMRNNKKENSLLEPE